MRQDTRPAYTPIIPAIHCRWHSKSIPAVGGPLRVMGPVTRPRPISSDVVLTADQVVRSDKSDEHEGDGVTTSVVRYSRAVGSAERQGVTTPLGQTYMSQRWARCGIWRQ